MRLRDKELLFIYLLFDLILLNFSLLITAFFNFKLLQNTGDFNTYFLHANLSWIITYFVFSKKNLFLRDGYINRVLRILKRTSIFIVVAGVLVFALKLNDISRLFLLETTAIFLASKLLFYWGLYKFLKKERARGRNSNRVVIVGYNDTGKYLRAVIDNTLMLGYNFVGFISAENDEDPDVVGKPENLATIIKEKNIQMVFVTLSLFTNSKQGKEYLRICNNAGVRLRFVPENQSWFKSRMNMESVGELVLINPQEIPLDDLEARMMKRLVDVGISLMTILFILSWLLPIIALIIKLSSKGPVFFVQERTGINNKSFKCLKFRSMRMSDDAHTRQATAQDDRITPIGRFMRKYNLDEFPQFFNVLFGQMSVVGPRPHMLKHTEEYTKLIDYYLARHYVKPGITGWAQVNGYRGETDELWKMEKRVEFDMDYIENWSAWLDVKIIYLTVFGKNTYKNAY